MLRIRRLTVSDIPFAMQLVEIVGWNQVPADWERLLRIGPEGCFLADWQGKPAATATATAYGSDCAWIGMVLVHPDFRRQGIGGAMICHCLNYLKSLGVKTIKLDATDEGRAVYLKQGFVDEYQTRRYVGQLNLPERTSGQCELRRLAAADRPAVMRMDRTAVGADRGGLLSILAETQPDLSMLALEDGRIVGYGFARSGRLFGYVGPVVAERMETAQALLAELSRWLPQKPVLVDTTAGNPAWCAWLESSGLQLQRQLRRMYSGTNDSPGQTSLAYALSGFETG